MNRAEIKKKAKEMIKGNKWYLWKPLLIFGLVFGVLEGAAYGIDSALGLIKTGTIELFGEQINYTSTGIVTSIISFIVGFASAAFYVGYAHFTLSFVRGKKLELKDILEFMKKHWAPAFVIGLLTGLCIIAGLILLIIPGIIVSIGLMYYREVCADNIKMPPVDMLKKSWAITKGHKMELFVMGLSFCGWIILAPLTLGILYIWLIPYMIVAFTLAYEKIK